MDARHAVSTVHRQCSGQVGVYNNAVITEESSSRFLNRTVYTRWLSSLPFASWVHSHGPPTLALDAAPWSQQECLQLYILHTCPCILLELMVHLAPSLLRQPLLLAAGILPVFP